MFYPELPAGRAEVLPINGGVCAYGRARPFLKFPIDNRASPSGLADLMEDIMNRCTAILTGMALWGLAIVALPQVALAQNDPLDGLWQVNLAKSKLAGPFAGWKSMTLYLHGEGQSRRDTVVAIDPQGNPFSGVLMHIYDGQPHPSTGSPDFDASAYTRVDAHTINYSRTKAGKVVSTGTIAVSQDGKSQTITDRGTDASGREWNSVAVFDKQ
jgi:hypothetical protein